MKHRKKLKAIFPLLLFALTVVCCGSQGKADGNGVTEKAVLSWKYDFSPEKVTGGHLKSKNPFMNAFEEIEDGAPLLIGVDRTEGNGQNYVRAAMFEKIGYLGYCTYKDMNEDNAETFEPLIIRDPQAFTIKNKARPQAIVDYLKERQVTQEKYRTIYNAKSSTVRGVVFDLYNYDGDQIGCDPTMRKTAELSDDEFFSDTVYFNSVRTELKNRLNADSDDKNAFMKVGPGLSMPQNYSFALIDYHSYYDEYWILPVIGKVTRDAGRNIVDFEIIAVFSVIRDSSGVAYYCWPDVKTFQTPLSACEYDAVTQRPDFTYLGGQAYDHLMLGYSSWNKGASDYKTGKKISQRLTLQVGEKAEYITDYDKEVVEITGDTHISNSLKLNAGTTMLIKENATLSLSGTIINQGIIRLEPGARLIVGATGGIQTIDCFTDFSRRVPDKSGRIICDGGEVVVLEGGYIVLSQPKDPSGSYIKENEHLSGMFFSNGGSLCVAGFVSVANYSFFWGSHLQVEKTGVFLNGLSLNRPYGHREIEDFKLIWGATVVMRMNEDVFRNAVNWDCAAYEYAMRNAASSSEVESLRKKEFNRLSQGNPSYDSFKAVVEELACDGWQIDEYAQLIFDKDSSREFRGTVHNVNAILDYNGTELIY